MTYTHCFVILTIFVRVKEISSTKNKYVHNFEKKIKIRKYDIPLGIDFRYQHKCIAFA
jgi:hypothetical protein